MCEREQIKIIKVRLEAPLLKNKNKQLTFKINFEENEKNKSIQRNYKEILELRQCLRKECPLYFIYPLPILNNMGNLRNEYSLLKKEVFKFFLFLTEHIDLDQSSIFYQFFNDDFIEKTFKEFIKEQKNFSIPKKFESLTVPEQYEQNHDLIEGYKSNTLKQLKDNSVFNKSIAKIRKSMDGLKDQNIRKIFKFINMPQEDQNQWKELQWNVSVMGSLIMCQLEISEDYLSLKDLLQNFQKQKQKLIEEVYQLGKQISRNQDPHKDIHYNYQISFKRKQQIEINEKIDIYKKLLFVGEKFILEEQSDIIKEYKDTQVAFFTNNFAHAQINKLHKEQQIWEGIIKQTKLPFLQILDSEINQFPNFR